LLLSAGKLQRDPASGKLKRDAATGRLIRNTASVTDCCCAAGTTCREAFFCADGTSAGFYESTADVTAGVAYKPVAGGSCYYFSSATSLQTPAGGTYDSFAGCAECVADAGDEVCETCDVAYHNSLPASVTLASINASSCNESGLSVPKNAATNCGYTGGVTWTCGASPPDTGTVTITYSSITCKYTMVVTKSGFGGTCSGTATYEHDAFDDPLLDEGPRGDYFLISSTGTCTWDTLVSVAP
jgi:hypothetical protein